MAQSLSKILFHVVFRTKDRQNLIPIKLQPELWAYLAVSCRAHGSEAFRVGGTKNHVHIACTLSRTQTVAALLEEIKKTSSAWMKKQTPDCNSFAWQSGYGAFSLGQSQLQMLLSYIDNQEAHHRKRTFKEEYVALLIKYEVDYEDRYLWE